MDMSPCGAEAAELFDLAAPPPGFHEDPYPTYRALSDRLRMAWPDAAGDDSSSGCGPERPEAGWPSLAGRQSATPPT
jgi:hypothetical protein